MKQLAVLVVFTVIAVMTQVDGSMAETKSPGETVTAAKADQTIKGQGVDAASIRQALLNPKGFDMDYSCLSRSGHSRVFFREDGQKIVTDISVVDIKNVDINKTGNFELESCTNNAQLTEGGVMFNGCSDESRNVFLAYDPGDRKASFKGSGRDCAKIELSPR